MRSALAALALSLALPTGHAADARQMEANKKSVVAFYEKAINQKDFDAASKHLGPRYIQHNPVAADGPEGPACSEVNWSARRRGVRRA